MEGDFLMLLPHLQNYQKSTQNWKVGQTKAICCPGAGEQCPKRPVPVTVEIAADRSGAIDIDRLSRDGQPLQDKGNNILKRFLKSNFAQGNKIRISASIFFETSCTLVPRDSASMAELLALLSRIADLPVRQDIPVTGVINPAGKVGASDDLGCRIEHYFDARQTEGLPGHHGLMVPQAAVANLVLRRDVIQAIENQCINLIPVRTVEEGLQILSGVEVEEKDASGKYPPGTVNYRVQQCLQRRAV
jgi:predicted ATP-dependent protease